ncbi:MAG: ABC transporter ATP-binding protein [Candidatus Aenigmarchaeota archaeon]|nr:ABC transporter ATP-binding protein [Candidatus Aenigmarchaeota archaeon]
MRTRNVRKTYRSGTVEVNALNGVTADIKKGEFVAIMGPSGSGKSTLLHVIGTLDQPTSGTITIKGVDVLKLSDDGKTSFRLKEMGFVFQFYSLLPELTAAENVFVPQMLIGKSGGEMTANCTEILTSLGLRERMHNYPLQLSGGEQQRIAIARALVNKPELLLADEPTASLDSKSAQNVLHAFKELNETLGQTIVMVTHDEHLGRMADRGIWLRDGMIEKEKTF